MPVIDAAEQQANGFFLVGSMVILLAKWIVQSAMYRNRRHYKAMPVIGKNDLIKQLCQDKIMKRDAKDCPDNKSMVGVHDPHQEMIDGGVISLKDKSYKVALVYGQMDELLGACARVALTGLIVAEYFRDQEDRHVLLFMVNIFRSTQAGSEVSALLGRTPSAMGYQPTLAADMSSIQKRITTTKGAPSPQCTLFMCQHMTGLTLLLQLHLLLLYSQDLWLSEEPTLQWTPWTPSVVSLTLT